MDGNRMYVLITVHPQRTQDVYSALQMLPELQFLDVITGPYDLIAVVEGTTCSKLMDLVVEKIRRIDGVAKTITCFAVKPRSECSWESP